MGLAESLAVVWPYGKEMLYVFLAVLSFFIVYLILSKFSKLIISVGDGKGKFKVIVIKSKES